MYFELSKFSGEFQKSRNLAATLKKFSGESVAWDCTAPSSQRQPALAQGGQAHQDGQPRRDDVRIGLPLPVAGACASWCEPAMAKRAWNNHGPSATHGLGASPRRMSNNW